MKRRGLGRGLDALLSVQPGISAVDSVERDELRYLPIDLIQRGKHQPRVDLHEDTLAELADSIRAEGVVQPIIVRPVVGTDRFEIIAGERRWRATQKAGLHVIPALVREVPDRSALSIALIENIQREDLNPLEEARAFAQLIRDFKMTHEEVAQAVGRSRAAVTNIVRLLELSDDVKSLLQQGQIEMGHGRTLLGLDKAAQSKAARVVVSKGLSVRETERMVRRLQAPAKKKMASRSVEDPNIRQLQDELSEKLGANVQIQHGARGAGKITIRYHSVEELDGILAHIK